MHFSGIAQPEELAILTTAVDDYCREAGIDPGSPERDEIARLVMTLFNNGAAIPDELRAALHVRSERDARRCA